MHPSIDPSSIVIERVTSLSQIKRLPLYSLYSIYKSLLYICVATFNAKMHVDACNKGRGFYYLQQWRNSWLLEFRLILYTLPDSATLPCAKGTWQSPFCSVPVFCCVLFGWHSVKGAFVVCPRICSRQRAGHMVNTAFLVVIMEAMETLKYIKK